MVSVKNKLSSCFHPFAADVEPRVNSLPPPSTSSDAGESRRESKTAHHTLSGFVKAVFFRNTLLKKIRSKRWNRDTYYRTSSNTSASKMKRAAKKNKKTQSRNNKPISDPEEFSRNNSNRSSLFSSSSSSSIASSISSNSSSGSDRIKLASSDHFPVSSTSFKQHALNLVSRSSRGDCRGLLFIVLVCLVALVFWGKFFAIVTCTSAWLFLAPGRAKPFGGRIEGSEEHNKRVIMEGLLGRNVVRSRIVERDI